MTRLILLLGLILVLWFLVESRLRRLRRRFDSMHQARSTRATASAAPSAPTAPTALLVRCSRCGTYIPQSQARLESGGAFCQPSCPGPAPTSG